MARNDSSNRPVPPGSSVCTLRTLYTALYKWPTEAHFWAWLRYIQVACGMRTTTQRVVRGHTSTSQAHTGCSDCKLTMQAGAWILTLQLRVSCESVPIGSVTCPAGSPAQEQDIALHKNLRIILDSSGQGRGSPPIISAPLGDLCVLT